MRYFENTINCFFYRNEIEIYQWHKELSKKEFTNVYLINLSVQKELIRNNNIKCGVFLSQRLYSSNKEKLKQYLDYWLKRFGVLNPDNEILLSANTKGDLTITFNKINNLFEKELSEITFLLLMFYSANKRTIFLFDYPEKVLSSSLQAVFIDYLLELSIEKEFTIILYTVSNVFLSSLQREMKTTNKQIAIFFGTNNYSKKIKTYLSCTWHNLKHKTL